jgi:hypothetical protein
MNAPHVFKQLNPLMLSLVKQAQQFRIVHLTQKGPSASKLKGKSASSAACPQLLCLLA